MSFTSGNFVLRDKVMEMINSEESEDTKHQLLSTFVSSENGTKEAIKQLRKYSGMPMMDCKKVLNQVVEDNGGIEKIRQYYIDNPELVL